MKIVRTVKRELTENELLTIERFCGYTDGVSFALIGDHVTVMIDETESNDPDKLKAAAEAIMEETISSHPDFDVIALDDGCTMILMPSGAVAFTSTNSAPRGNGLYLALRATCLEACERGEVIAVAFEEDGE